MSAIVLWFKTFLFIITYYMIVWPQLAHGRCACYRPSHRVDLLVLLPRYCYAIRTLAG
jgi:hypothetical protein